MVVGNLASTTEQSRGAGVHLPLDGTAEPAENVAGIAGVSVLAGETFPHPTPMDSVGRNNEETRSRGAPAGGEGE